MKRRTTNAVRRLQRGTENLEPGPLPPEKRLIGPKEKAGLYDPGLGTPLEQAQREHESLMTELRKSVYGTIGVNINGKEMEIPLWNKDMTPEQAEEAARDRLEMGLHPFSPERDLRAAQGQYAENQTPGFAQGTDSVPAMLTPHEAVLNPNAAELEGRSRIRSLNAQGNKLAARGVNLVRGFASGTDDVKDLLRDTEDTFYGGGQAPRPTPKPTPIPRLYAYGTRDVTPYDTPEYDAPRRSNAASRYGGGGTSRYRGGGGILNVPPDDPVSASRYIGRGGVDLGAQYDPTGGVNALPRGAVGVQGNPNADAFNRSLNGSQAQVVTPPAPLSPWQVGADISRRNLTSAGSLLGATQQGVTSFGQNATPSLYPQRPDRYPITPEGNINFNIPGGSMKDALSRGPSDFYRPSANPVESSNDTGGYGSAYEKPSGPPGVTVDELTQAGIRPGRYADATGPIVRSGTGFSYATKGGHVDIAGPMHFAAVRAAVEHKENYGY